jgi:cobalt-zinc-cadmium efflux system outer membrane protein
MTKDGGNEECFEGGERPGCLRSANIWRWGSLRMNGEAKESATRTPHMIARRCLAGLLLLGFAALTAQSAGAQQGLTLHQAVASALEASPAAHASADQVDMQRGVVEQANLIPNPRLFLQTEDLRPWASNYSFGTNSETYGYLGQTIEIDGKRRKRTAFAKAGLARMEAEHATRLRQISFRVGMAYWSAVAAERAKQLWKAQVDDFDTILRYHRDRVAAGAMAGVDLLRMQVERDRVELEYQNAIRADEQARIALGREMGKPLPSDSTFAEDVDAMREIPPQAMDALVEQRPDVMAARDAVEEAIADERLQRAVAVPDPDLLGGYKRNTVDNTIFVGLQIPIPFFNRNQGEIARANSQERYAEDQLAQTRQVARAEIDAAKAAYEREQQTVSMILPGMRDHARQNAAIISDAYASGGTDLLRYLDAKRTSIDTQLLALQTMAAYQKAAVQLELMYGGQL